MKKRILSVFLALLLLLGCAACRSGEAATRGKLRGNVYKNQYLQIRCDIPEDWAVFTESQRAAYDVGRADAFEGYQFQQQVQRLEEHNDLFAYAADGSAVLGLTIWKNVNKGYFLTDRTLMTQRETFTREQMAQVGWIVAEYSVETVSFCGEEKACLRMTFENQDYIQYTLQLREDRDYEATVTLNATDEDALRQMLTYFSKLP